MNPVTAYIIEFKDLADYAWSSYYHYMKDIDYFIFKETIMKKFRTKEKLAKFTADQADYQRKLDNIKRLILE